MAIFSNPPPKVQLHWTNQQPCAPRLQYSVVECAKPKAVMVAPYGERGLTVPGKQQPWPLFRIGCRGPFTPWDTGQQLDPRIPNGAPPGRPTLAEEVKEVAGKPMVAEEVKETPPPLMGGRPCRTPRLWGSRIAFAAR